MLSRFFRASQPDVTPSPTEALAGAVRQHMSDADDATVALVGAVAGLFACVAYADREYSQEEQDAVDRELGRIGGLSSAGATAIAAVLRSNIAELANESLQTYTRVLYDGIERGARLEILEVLVDLAAADDLVTMDETNLLRRVARGLGLGDDEYTALQARYRERLSLLQ